MGGARGEPEDDAVAVLARMFAEHPAWRAAARYLSPEATSDVYFSQRPGEVWHLALCGDGARLLPGRADDPDLVLRFAPGAVRRMAQAEGGIADFAMELFARIECEDPDRRVDLRIAAPFGRLVRRGYVKLLLAGGPRLLALGARRGVRNVSGLHRLVEAARRPPDDWELPR